MLEPASDHGLNPQLGRFHVDHATPGDSGGRRSLQICRLEYQVLVVVHLDDLTRHQAQLPVVICKEGGGLVVI